MAVTLAQRIYSTRRSTGNQGLHSGGNQNDWSILWFYLSKIVGVLLCRCMTWLGAPRGSTSLQAVPIIVQGFSQLVKVRDTLLFLHCRFNSLTGKCVHEIAEHNHYVQGVAWDPLNEYIATQSSDRSMHVYSISFKSGSLEVHAVGKNTRMPHRQSSTPSRPSLFRRESTASEAESIGASASEHREESVPSGSQQGTLLTPTASVPSTPSLSMFPPPPYEKSSSRRSSFSSNAPSSPATYTRYARSPSPMPALPAIRMPIMPTSTWSSIKLYGDESYTNFFRRLTFSPDGGLLLTPAGQFEDPFVFPQPSKGNEEPTSRGRKGHPSAASNENSSQASTSSVYIYSRANFARPPIARLPGHKKASVAVRFSPILYELRPGVSSSDTAGEPVRVAVERGSDRSVKVDLAGPSPRPSQTPENLTIPSQKLSASSSMASPIAAPSPRIAIPSGAQGMMMPPSPALSATDSQRPLTPAMSKPATPAVTPISLTSSVFALPYRMLYAVATMDTIAIHDSQQAGPVCLLTKLHYDEFTDMSWYVNLHAWNMCSPNFYTLLGLLMGNV